MSTGYPMTQLLSTLDLAKRAQGLTGPNPLVGAVLVTQEGQIFQGFHSHYRGPHAEAVVLAQAGSSARGAQLFCSLEPCSHSGKGKHNPPCVRAIIDSGVSQVIIGQPDPNPRVRGQGIRQLQDAGIQVMVARDFTDFIRLNPGFVTTHALGRPYIHIKAGMTLDGYISTGPDVRTAITNEQARRVVHELRSQVDGVAVGIGTVLADNPSLDVRLWNYPRNPGMKQPFGVVFDRQLRIPMESTLVSRRSEQLIIVTSSHLMQSPKAKELEQLGIRIAGTPDGSLSSALSQLPQFAIQNLLIEGGSTILGELFRTGTWDQVSLHIAPKLLGKGVRLFERSGFGNEPTFIEFDHSSWSILGDHGIYRGYRQNWMGELAISLESILKQEGMEHVHRIS